MSNINLPNSMNLGENKGSATQDADGSFLRFRSDNADYVNGDVIRIEIPCSRSGLWLHPCDSFISLNMTMPTFTVTGGTYKLDQTIMSAIRQLRIYHSSNLLVSINEYGRLANAMLDVMVTASERLSSTISLGIGASQTTGTGAEDFSSVNTESLGCYGHVLESNTTYNYAFTLMCPILGSLTSKSIPIGLMTGSLYIELVLDDITKIITSRTGINLVGEAGGITANGITSANQMKFSNIYYNAKCTQLNKNIDLILQNALLQGGRSITIPSTDFKLEQKSLAAGSQSCNEKLSFNFSSCKFLWWWLVNTTTANGSALANNN